MRSCTHVANMYIQASVNVVEKVPARMIGIVIDDKVVSTVPAPIRTQWPVPGCDFKVEAAGDPEPVMPPVDPQNAFTEHRPHAWERRSWKWTVEMEAGIIAKIMPKPLIVVHVLRFIDPSVAQRFACNARR